MSADRITEQIIACALKVSGALGVGFLEKVYENALVVELVKAGFNVEQQKETPVVYDGVVVGNYTADIIVNGKVIIELKAAKIIDEVHQAELLNYLKATGIRVGLLLNFGTPKLGMRRMIL